MSVINFPFYGNAIYGAFINLPTGVPDGTLALTLDTYSLWVYKTSTATWIGVNVTPSSATLFPAGTVALPGIAIGTVANGLFYPAANTIGVSCNATQVAKFDSTGDLYLGLTTVATSSLRAYGSQLFLNYGNVAATSCLMATGSQDGAMAFSGDQTLPSTAGGGLIAYGRSHATKAGKLELYGVNVLGCTFGAAGAATFSVGAVGAPSINVGDATSGVYRIGANNIGVAISGAKVLDIASTGLAVTGVVSGSTGMKTVVSTANTANPPTNAELISAFGAAATVGAGFFALVDDNAGHANEYLIFSDGTKYWQITATAAA